MPENATILEAGCGSGEGIAVLANEKRLSVGSDISEQAVIKTSSCNNAQAVKGDNFALPFADNTFDLVFNSGVIEHFKYPDNVRQVREMRRVAKPGGELIINVPNALCLWYLAVKYVLRLVKKWKFGYEEAYTPWRLRATVEAAGLRPIAFTGFLCMPPFATTDREILPLRLRKKIAWLEKYLPFKEYYCYSTCVLCKKGKKC